MQTILQLKGDLKSTDANSIALKVSNTEIFMNDALDLMQRLTLKDTYIEVLPDDERRSIHLLAVAIAAATAAHNVSVKAEADMYADFIIASKAISNIQINSPYKSEEDKNNAYDSEVIRLTKEYDNEKPASNPLHYLNQKQS